MDARAVFPSVICQGRIIKSALSKIAENAEESMMRNSNQMQMPRMEAARPGRSGYCNVLNSSQP